MILSQNHSDIKAVLFQHIVFSASCLKPKLWNTVIFLRNQFQADYWDSSSCQSAPWSLQPICIRIPLLIPILEISTFTTLFFIIALIKYKGSEKVSANSSRFEFDGLCGRWSSNFTGVSRHFFWPYLYI